MARHEDRRKAIELRLRGFTYSEIRKELDLSKSTLSGWLTNYHLTKDQLKRVDKKKELQIEHYRQSCARRRKLIDDEVYNTQKAIWTPLSNRELFLAGLFLYWGEGTKVGSHIINISNSDPRVIKFALFWLKKCIKIPLNKIRVLVHLYSDMDIGRELDYWSKTLGIPRTNFTKPYVKSSTRAGLTYKSFGHGTCNITYLNVQVKREIMQTISAISDFYANIDII
ncbi:hypothetical protein A2872_00990 [Candidatus Gottesmanbacteria bacterium RIFCSPHIGHO2_01_FULL_42_12]|uniref:Uncharacterized protein n=1 Tax=Candidatus Gottesmanbacteria bacterium RIFCSPHIGHO2_01_FULL_42_12 TaxID=1798377 RepID=A0A1F5Z2U9_9BACT|nr:MAG: hypothetical protein A2872_00990 [Candidatus Gottesmanbacteria bacterium RIFCSPHIGHO2_01_FULL_42_12]